MRSTRKLIVSALAATALLAAIASTASARQFLLSNRHIRIVFTPLIFTLNEGSRVSCTVTLEGSFHSTTITKRAEALIGYTTSAIAHSPGCRSAGVETGIKIETLRETLPWHITYVDFSGTLPAARPRIRLNRIRFNILNVPLIGTCRYTASPMGIISGPAGGGVNEGAASFRDEEAQRFPSETPFCSEYSFSARAPIWLLGSTIGINVTLI